MSAQLQDALPPCFPGSDCYGQPSWSSPWGSGRLCDSRELPLEWKPGAVNAHSFTFLHLINAPPFQEDIVMLGIRNNTKNSLILRTLRERGATNGSGRLPTAAQVTAHHFYLNSNQWIDHFSSLSLPKKWNHWPPILLVQMITINFYICRWESRKDIWRGGWKRIAAQ